jgi:protoporphyrinogen/coproporphyrinogen III oxidase
MSSLAEFSKTPRSPALHDESIRSFMLRRFSPGITDNVVSAVFHGIYAGDIDRLSARSLLPMPWDYEKRHGSVLNGILSELYQQKSPIPVYEMSFLKLFAQFYAAGAAYQEHWCSQMFELRRSASLYTFKGGMEELIKALSGKVRSLGVEFRHGARITELTPRSPGSQGSVSSFSDIRVQADDAKIDVSWSWSPGKTKTDTFTHVISALPANALLSALSNERSQRAVLETSDIHRLSIPTVTVMVVNLYYTNPRLVKRPGFGYLLPRSLAFEQNPEFALGVVFDSYATPDLDDSSGTKLTVMLGGHWWDGWKSFPSEAEGIRMARSLLRRQLDIEDEPALAVATLQKDCIPQYHVGHTERATALGRKLREAFGNHLEVAGASWHGVSVNDCIKSGFLAAYSIATGSREVDLMKTVDRAALPAMNVPRGSVAAMFKRPAKLDDLNRGD